MPLALGPSQRATPSVSARPARRRRGLAWALQETLGVRHVWCDTRSEHSSQRFVLWAGAVLEQRREFQEILQVRGCAHAVPSAALLYQIPRAVAV